MEIKIPLRLPNFILRIICLCILVFSFSCRKCKEGCDTIIRINGAALNINDTVVHVSEPVSVTTISFDPIVAKEEGDRDCKYKTEISCTKDGLDAAKLSLYCNKELIISGVTYPMNTDLLEVPELVRTSSGNKLPFVVLQTTPDFPKGRYHFLLQGQTNDGKDVEDIGVVSWE